MDSKFFKKSEYQGLKKFYRHSPRNRSQLNTFNTSDTETVRLRKDLYVVSSTDSIAIEIHSGLYKLPDTWGHLAIANSVSDLAASGAEPIGMLISAQWAPAHSGLVKDQIYASMSKALKKFKVPLLGGDSGSSKETVITATILGESASRPLDRIGIKSGDVAILFGTELGYGPAMAFDYLMHSSKHKWESRFRPIPDWQNIYKFRKYFKASIDTSDGIYNSLSTLAELNDVTFTITANTIKLAKAIRTYQNKFNIPIQYFIESDLGDLQTCVIMNASIYEKIKRQLPRHQLIAHARKKMLSGVRYDDISQLKNYLFLPHILEHQKFNYKASLNLWMKQYSR